MRIETRLGDRFETSRTLISETTIQHSFKCYNEAMKTLRANNLRTLESRRLPTLGQRANMARRLKTSQRDAQRLRVWKKSPRCASCAAVVAFESFELDHVTPLCDGGDTGDDNAQVLCQPCHRYKTVTEIRDRARTRRAGSWIYGDGDDSCNTQRPHGDFLKAKT